MTRVSVHPSLILWLSALGYLAPRVLLPFLGAAALHELGHLLMLRRLGRMPRRLELRFSGAQLETPPLSYRQELLAASAGPLVSLLMGLLFPLAPYLAFYSVALGCFNLLPVPGLDGGRMLRCALLLRLPPGRALRVVRWTGMVTALGIWGGALWLCCGLGMGVWPLLPAALFLYKALSMEE